MIAIGLATEPPELDEALGCFKTSQWAYYSHNGGIYLGCRPENCTYETYTKGDVVGCGIDNQKQLFFTKNGKRLGEK